MALLQQWRDKAYNDKANKQELQKLWSDYFRKERDIYAELLKNPDEEVKGTVKELADKYGISLEYMVGFLDGINDSLKIPNPIDDMTEDTVVSLAFDKEKLYMNMVDARADWLYGIPAWDNIFDETTKKSLYMKAKKMNTIVKPKKIYPNDPCPCGSGKKYKNCCGRKKAVG